MQLNYLEICAGIGGFSRGFEMAGVGWTPAAFCEIEDSRAAFCNCAGRACRWRATSTRSNTSTGRRLAALCTKPGPVGSCLKILLTSGNWRSTVFRLTWKAWATKSGRVIFRLAASKPRTSGNGVSSLPTLKASGGGPERTKTPGRGGENLVTELLKLGGMPTLTVGGGGQTLPENATLTGMTPGGVKRTVSLKEYLNRALPTLRATDGDKGGRGDLIQALCGNENKHFKAPLPTLTVHGNNNRVGASAKSGNGLATALRTLSARDWEGPSAQSWRDRTTGDKTPTLCDQLGGPLNPDWLDWYMGFPLGWTDPDVPSEALESRPFTDPPDIPPLSKQAKLRQARIKALGNAVVPAVVAEIAKAIEASRMEGGG